MKKFAKIAIGSDHAGFALKEQLRRHLDAKGISVVDCGTDSDQSTDYPDYALHVAKLVGSNEVDAGVLICGTGIGMSMTANKIRGVRAAVCVTTEMARLSREHNNANILCLGARLTDEEAAFRILETWLNADFLGGRHERRVNKIHSLTHC